MFNLLGVLIVGSTLTLILLVVFINVSFNKWEEKYRRLNEKTERIKKELQQLKIESDE